jgi:hypothetical protein
VTVADFTLDDADTLRRLRQVGVKDNVKSFVLLVLA